MVTATSTRIPVETEFHEIKEEPKKSTAITTRLKRHPLMSEREMPYVKEIQEEADLDRELGLRNQVRMDELDMIRHDIDELTKATDYVEVNDRDIENLFGIGMIRAKCLFHTLRMFLKSPLGIALEVLVALVCMAIIGGNNDIKWMAVTCGAAAVITFVIILIQAGTDGFEVGYFHVKMQKDMVRDTTIRIPKGAKLKLKEAVDSKVFNEFYIVDPRVEVENIRIVAPTMNADPAIIGITHDNRKFLIVCWDVENESLKVNKKSFAKLKLKQASKSRRSFEGFRGV